MNAPEFYSEPQSPDTFLNCWKCGASGRVEEMHGDDYSLDSNNPEWACHCEKCHQETRRNVEEMMPRVHQLIENAMMREGITFRLNAPALRVSKKGNNTMKKLRVTDRSEEVGGTRVELRDDSGFTVWEIVVTVGGALKVRNNEASLQVILDCANTLYIDPRP